MTTKTLDERLIDEFGDTNAPSWKGASYLHGLIDHSRWLVSEGRFGRRYELNDGRVHRKLFSYTELDAIDLSRALFVKTDFSWSNLRLTRFVGAEFRTVNFVACDLEGADFTGAIFENVSFQNCLDIHLARFDKVSRILNGAEVQKNWKPSLPQCHL